MKIINKIRKDNYFLKKIFLTSFSRGIAALGTFFLNFTLAKTLSIDEYGSYMLAYTILIGMSFIVKFGMPTAILRFASIFFRNKEFTQIKKLKKQVNLLIIILSVFCIFLLISSKGYISDALFDDDVSFLILIFCIVLPFYSYINIQSSFLKAYKKPELAPLFEIGLTAFITSGIVFITDYFKIITITKEFVAISFLVSCVLIVVVGAYVLSTFINETQDEVKDKQEQEYIFIKTLPDYALSSIVNYLLKFSPVVILGYFVSEDQVGLYSIANSITFTISFILWIVSAVYAPHYASLYNENKIKKLSSILKKSTLYMMFIAFPIFLIIMIFPTEILGLFGENYLRAKIALRVLAIAQLFNIITGPVYFLLNMTGHQKKLRNIVLLTALISVFCSLTLVPFYGFMGAIYSTSIGLFIQNSLAFYQSKKIIGIKLI